MGVHSIHWPPPTTKTDFGCIGGFRLGGVGDWNNETDSWCVKHHRMRCHTSEHLSMFVSERGTSTSWADRQEEKEWSGSQQTADKILSIKGGCRDGIETRDLNCRAAEMEI